MAAMKKFRSVEHFFDSAEYWKPEIERLREIVLSTGLEEQLKWSFPCYTRGKANVVGIGCFKSYFGLWFFQGSYLSDPNEVLFNCSEGKTKAMRQWRMTTKKEIKVRVIKDYIKRATELADKGISLKPDRAKPIIVPPELARTLEGNIKARERFEALTKGKKREFTEYIASAKRAETKQKRLEKIIPMILEGIGLHDKYR